MKKILLFTTIASLFLMWACSDEPSKGNPNFWKSNDLRKMQLRGNVRKVIYTGTDKTLSEQRIYEFDAKGNIVKFLLSLLYSDGKTGVLTEDYQYNSAGQLASITSSMGVVCSFNYGNHGIFVPVNDILFILGYGFVSMPNLFEYDLASISTSVDGREHSWDFSVSGNTMTFYYEKYSVADTLTITLNGSKYPLKGIDSKGREILSYSYYANNMLKLKRVVVYEEDKEDEEGKIIGDETINYIADDDYLFPSKTEEYKIDTDSVGSNPRPVWIFYNYQYNDYKDISVIDYINLTVQSSEYIYNEFDENGNWTDRIIANTYSSQLADSIREIREISY